MPFDHLRNSVLGPVANVCTWLCPSSARNAGRLPLCTEMVSDEPDGALCSWPTNRYSVVPWDPPATAAVAATSATSAAARTETIVLRFMSGLLMELREHP